MKVPFSWLKDFVDIDCSAKELEQKLFSCGFEVEELTEVAKNVDKIVTCKILEIEKHPNADKLSVTQVDAGKYGKLQIITAAKNIAVGDIVPVALDGSTLYNGEHIYNGKLRGLPSQGMFCSGEEIGITDDWYDGASVNGILILKENYPLGADIKEVLELNDFIFDINVTANRPDCQSILGIAREVAAVLKKPIKLPDFSYKTCPKILTKQTVKVDVKAQDLCQRYKSHLVKNIKIAESPLWLKRRLFLMGLRSINNIVDITNYVLLEIGQPMHAFDLSDLEGKSIIVRRAENGEKITTLDNKEFSLCSDNLVICDEKKPVALAGVMGGLNSEIKETTADILFESAKFSRDNIRKTSRALGQRSDSSARYEKGVDYLSVENGMNRALNLISKLNCGDIAFDEYDIIDKQLSEKVIETTISKVNGVLGLNISSELIKNILESLNFVVNICGDNLTIKVPLYREDMESYQDVAEEIIREHGYDYIQPTLLDSSRITNGGRNYNQRKEENFKDFLASMGFNEIITYSFVPEKDFEIFKIDTTDSKDKYIKILNPISEEMAVMRTKLTPSMVRTVLYNLNRKNESGRLFELAKVYHPKSLPLDELPFEEKILCCALFGNDEDFFTAKGVVENLTDAFCNGRNVSYIKSIEKHLHPTRSADVYIENEKIGSIGELHPTVSEKVGIDKKVYIIELSYDKMKNYFNNKIVFKPLSKYPTVERDLAISVDNAISCGSIIDAIKCSGGKYLKNISLFDVYSGDQIEKGKKSLAFNLLYVSDEKTLSVEEVDTSIKSILKQLKDQFNAELR